MLYSRNDDEEPSLFESELAAMDDIEDDFGLEGTQVIGDVCNCDKRFINRLLLYYICK
jgi:hypothetical protein